MVLAQFWEPTWRHVASMLATISLLRAAQTPPKTCLEARIRPYPSGPRFSSIFDWFFVDFCSIFHNCSFLFVVYSLILHIRTCTASRVTGQRKTSMISQTRSDDEAKRQRNRICSLWRSHREQRAGMTGRRLFGGMTTTAPPALATHDRSAVAGSQLCCALDRYRRLNILFICFVF